MLNLLNKPKSNVYEEILVQCKKHGISVSELCRKAKIRRQLLNDWKSNDPKSIVVLKAITSAFQKMDKAIEKENK